MSYLHIPNLYKDQTILMFKECWALEKVHGTSAHVRWHDGRLDFSSGSSDAAVRDEFLAYFAAIPTLQESFLALGHPKVAIYGETYGGKLLRQAWRYGERIRFVAFDVRIGPHWLSVPQAADVVAKVGLEFVAFRRIETTLEAIDAERDAPSAQAWRNDVVGDHPREGVVLRPLIELTRNNGDRIIAKHKRDDARETTTPRKVVDPAQWQVLTEAEAIANEWVTPARLEHVTSKLEGALSMCRMRKVIDAMTEDVLREGSGEIVDSKEARTAIGRKTAELFKLMLQEHD